MPRWTNEQLDAINKSGTNIIVSAGAGSGKTAVLSERVLRILRENIHINELLVLTFTNLAASEMRERIRNKIKEDKSLIDELDLIDTAYITTFDSFAFSIVKKYHYLLNIRQNVKIIDNTIINIEKSKILDNILEEYLIEENPKFLKLINDFCIKDDKEIKQAILNINNKLEQKIDKHDFIHNYLEIFYNNNKIENDINKYLNLIYKKQSAITNLLNEIKIETNFDYYDKLSRSLIPLLESLEYKDIKSNSNIKLPPIPKESSDCLKELKEKISKKIKEIISLTSYQDIDEIRKTVFSTKDYAEIILEIIEKLDKKTNEYKFKNDLYEFNDIALLAIKIVKENEDVRNELKTQFKEILIDEYQDTNDIQEAFINLIASNNVYMVGDIKQSIYRFRNANPYIFKNKYVEYSKLNNGIKIDLNKNFRSREEVLDNINIIFNLIMDNKIGGAEYKETHNMIFGNNTYNEAGKTSNNNNMEIYSYKLDDLYKKEEIEAFIIANDIKQKIERKYQVFDKDKQVLRDINYNDFVILMDRTTNFELYKQIFTFSKIPLNIIKDLKMNDDMDLYIIKNIIKLIYKIKQNIIDEEFKYLFISCERSFLINEKDNIIFNYFLNNNFNESNLYEICLEISNNLDNMSLKELLEIILEKFKYEEKLLTLSNIESSIIRIDKIKEQIELLDDLGYNTEDLIEYLENLIENNIETTYSLNENTTNSVKIMTIHKSKGLEYHICYYPGLYKTFNISDLKDKFMYDNVYGLILPYFNEGIASTIYKELLKDRYIEEEISEKIRLFYVALTRAKEKMILIEPVTNNKNQIFTLDKKLEYRSFKDILDSIKPYISKYYKEINIENINIDKKYNLNKNIDIKDAIPTNNTKIMLKNIDSANKVLKENTYSKKPNELITNELKKNMEYGKKIHEIFEFIDFKTKDYSFLNALEKNKIDKFLNHDIFKNIENSNIYKEYEFIYQEDDTLNHGIIDLMIEYENYIDIIDYKLKKITDDSYLKQLNGYKKYIEKITNKKVNTYLYSILNNELKKI